MQAKKNKTPKPKPPTIKSQKKPKKQVVKVVQMEAVSAKSARRRMRKATSAAQGTSRALLVANSGLSKLSQRVALSTLLPYDAAPLRIRADSGDSYATSSAVAKHFNYYDFDVNDIVGQGLLCGDLPGGRKVWPDLEKQVFVVSILDAKIYAIVPSPKPVLDAIVQPRYLVRTFMNPSQTSAGRFSIPCVQTAPAGNAMAVSLERKINGGEPMELLFDDWPASSGPQVYGPKLAALDFEQKRCVWIDALPDGGTMPQCTIVYCMFNTTVPCQLPNNNSAGGPPNNTGESTLNIIATRINGSADEESQSITFSFPPGAGTVFTCTCRLQTSGYWTFAISGTIYTQTATTADLILDNFFVSVDLDVRLTCFAKHLVNGQLFATTTRQPYFATEQTNAGSLLIKNTTPQMMKGGMVYGVSNSTDACWWSAVSDNRIKDEMSQRTSRYQGDLSKGCYGWLRPMQRGFRNCNDTVTIQDGTIVSTLRSYSVSRKSPISTNHFRGMNIFMLVPPNPQSLVIAGSTTPCNITLVSAIHFEYTTLNQTPMVSNRGVDLSDVRAASALLAEVEVFTENALHLDAFMSAIRGLASGASSLYSKYRTSFQPLFGALSAFGHPVVSGLGKVALGLDHMYGSGAGGD